MNSINSDNSFTVMILFFVLTPMLILTMWYGANMLTGSSYQTALGIEDTKNYTVDSNWSEEGTLDNLKTDSDIIYADQNSNGIWTSFIQDFERSRILTIFYDADMRDGNGKLTVNAWKNNTSRSPDKTTTIDLESGENSQELGFETYDLFEIVISLNETAGSNNLRPNVDSFNAEFEIVEDRQVGLDIGKVQSLYYILMFISVFTISYISLKSLKIVLLE